MRLPGLNIQAIPATRRVESVAQLNSFLLDDRVVYRKSATAWVRTVAQRALDDALDAGNPSTFVVGIDGKNGRGFKRGTIASAYNAVQVLFVGETLAALCNELKPILEKTIHETFPESRTKRLRKSWSWWIQRYRLAGSKRPAIRLGAFVPDTISIYDVLWLVPDGPVPSKYSWFALYYALKGGGGSHKYNMVYKRKKKAYQLRRRLRGYLAEATRRMRGTKANVARSAITIQGWFVRGQLTGPQTRAARGVPVVRVAYRRGLARAVRA